MLLGLSRSKYSLPLALGGGRGGGAPWKGALKRPPLAIPLPGIAPLPGPTPILPYPPASEMGTEMNGPKGPAPAPEETLEKDFLLL